MSIKATSKKAMSTKSITVPQIQASKQSEGPPLVMLTAYDAPTAKVADSAGVDILLVGDSVGMVVLGYEDTLSVKVEDIAHHTAAVARAKPNALIVADLPWMSYHLSTQDTVQNAATLIRAGAQAVKLEGGTSARIKMIQALQDAEIPVMGHIGLTPQSMHNMGGFKVQAKTAQAAQQLAEQAKAVEYAGCFAVVLEGIPARVAQIITQQLNIPTIGIGAGPDCDGQVLVFHDLLEFGTEKLPRFVRSYGNLDEVARKGIAKFAQDVRDKKFPAAEESYTLDEAEDQLLSLS